MSFGGGCGFKPASKFLHYYIKPSMCPLTFLNVYENSLPQFFLIFRLEIEMQW